MKAGSILEEREVGSDDKQVLSSDLLFERTAAT